MTLKTEPLWASEAYHDYFYSVKPQYVTAIRPEYQANAGYSGYRSAIGIKYKWGNWVYGGFAAHFNLNGTTFADSPLVETHLALFTGAYISYIFYSR
ncbi:MAG: MipA/OmpV family protein [Campylobacterales bacterium]|nr:MipA/OmpV family protein [Campylobacterales bacterium]